MKPSDRLLFQQGGRCFFCRQPVPASEVSVEHLVASSNGGSNSESNLVVCCLTLNQLLGNLPLKDKLRVIIGDGLPFRCPAQQGRSASGTAVTTTGGTKRNSIAADVEPAWDEICELLDPDCDSSLRSSPSCSSTPAGIAASQTDHDAFHEHDKQDELHEHDEHADHHQLPSGARRGDSWLPDELQTTAPPIAAGLCDKAELKRRVACTVWRLTKTPPARPTVFRKLRAYLRIHVVGNRSNEELDQLLAAMKQRQMIKVDPQGRISYCKQIDPEKGF